MCWRSNGAALIPLTPFSQSGRRGDRTGTIASCVAPLSQFGRGAGDEGRSAAYRLAIALLLVLLPLFALASSVDAQRPNGAGLVIQHGDGTLIYAYVQFEEEQISGIDLLTRSGISATIAPFGGLGGGVCSINGEGCPADNCWCESYTNPAYYWHYYILDAGTWVELPLGASSRMLGDGDIDAWSWNAGEHGLPATTIDEIAALNGVDRNQPEPTPTPLPTDTPPSTATSPPPPTSTSVPPTATPTSPAATATATVSSATATTTFSPTAEARATVTGSAIATGSPSATPRPSPTTEPASSASATVRATIAATSTERQTSVAVIVTPGATPQPLPPDEGGGNRELLVFGALLAGVAVVGATVLVRNRRNGAP